MNDRVIESHLRKLETVALDMLTESELVEYMQKRGYAVVKLPKGQIDGQVELCTHAPPNYACSAGIHGNR